MFHEIPSRTKIFILVSSIALLILANGIYSIFQLEEIKNEFRLVAENDLPLSAVIAEINLVNLQSTILLEKARRLTDEVRNGDGMSKLENLREELLGSGKDFHFNIEASRHRLQRSVIQVEGYRGKRKHSRLITLLDILEKKNSRFEQEALTMIAAIDAHDNPATNWHYQLATAEKAELQKALDHLQSEIESLTILSSDKVLENESDMLRNKALFTLLTFVVGLWMVLQINRIILERDKAQAKIEFLAIHDPLTGLYNRRHFLARVSEALAGSKRYGYDVSLCICDLDHFKTINDSHGHTVGDEVLRRFAQTITTQIRADDLTGRYGGDEFVILMPNTNALAAQKVLERVRERFASEVFYLPEGGSFSLSATFGITDFDHQIPEPTLLIEKADLALYEAKKQGRNCVVAQSNVFGSA